MSLWKNTDTQAGKPRFLSLGQIDAITVTTGGTAYTPTNGTASVTIAAPPVGGDQATGTVTIVGGVLTSVVITNPGAGYTSAPAVTYTTGGTAGTLEAKTRANADALNGSVVFVDETEAQVATNRAKGIKTPGWMIYKE